MSEPFLTTLGPWERVERVPENHHAVIPGGKHAGVLYNGSDQAVAFLWADDGLTLPGWRLDIKMVAYVEDSSATSEGSKP